LAYAQPAPGMDIELVEFTGQIRFYFM